MLLLAAFGRKKNPVDPENDGGESRGIEIRGIRSPTTAIDSATLPVECSRSTTGDVRGTRCHAPTGVRLYVKWNGINSPIPRY
jgi:hypothetical protein